MSLSATAPPPARLLATAWFGLALAALGLSVLAALALIAVRLPFFDHGMRAVVPLLALHAVLAAPLWLLSATAGVLALIASRPGIVAWGSWWLALAGTVALVVSPVFGGGVSLSGLFLLPMLDNALFLGGMGTFALALGIVVVRSLPSMWRFAGGPPWQVALAWVLPALAGVLALALAVAVRADSVAGLVEPLWGVDHALQFVYVLLLVAAWAALAEALWPGVFLHRRLLHGVLGLALFPVAGVIALTIVFPAGSAEYIDGIFWLARWAFWPAAALLATVLTFRLVTQVRRHSLNIEQQGLALSLLLFAAGAAAGAAVSSDPIATPAFLHGTLGALTLAGLLAWQRWLAGHVGADRYPGRPSRIALVYGATQLLLVVAPTIVETAGAGHDGFRVFGATVQTAAMWVARAGGAAAALALAACVLNGLRSTAERRSPNSERRRDMRPFAIGITLLLVAGGGWLVQSVPRSDGAFVPREHAAERLKADIEQRFQQGVIMLHAKQYEHALTAFHRVLQLAPEMPEAYVNTGFALLGMQRYKEAADFFESATQLRTTQVNAYYGLAVALEGLGDLPGALGAMRTYVHLSKPDDPFRPKAEAAIWEWSAARSATTPSRSAGDGADAQPPAIPSGALR